ncbi:class I SAM-dependent methyltransferase [Chloroflexota bacterium]
MFKVGGKTTQILYRKPIIYFYDPFALGFGCRLLWGCSTEHLVEFYNDNISSNHLDIGVGTGYFLDKCDFPSTNPRLALMDLNSTCLVIAARRLARYKPEVYQENILETIHITAPQFDSIGMLNLLHCLPGDMVSKGIAFEHIKGMLNSDGIVFGSTILGKDLRHNLFTSLALAISNAIGTMSNMKDDLEGLQNSLRKHFSESHVHLIGNEAIFWAKL